MGRKGWFQSFSSETHAPGSSDKVKVYASSFADNSSSSSEDLSNRVEEVQSCKLEPLPRRRAYPQHAVGIDDQVNSVIQLLDWGNETEVAVAVILHGLGGTGKTTIADAVVARLDTQGWICSTVVPLESIGSNMTICEDGQGEIQDKQTFIYIDNGMVRGEHILKLLPNSSCKQKLRLLVTARDEKVADVLSHSGIHTHVYSVKPLLSQDAMELLFKKMEVPVTMQIPDHHMTLINEILRICDGVPLVLERIGEYICQSQDKGEAYKRVIEWSNDGKPFSSAEDQYSIDKNGLLFDLDELPASAKETFLDICYFFNGWDWDRVSCIMGEDGLNSLVKRALLLKKEDCKNKVMVRQIISTIGRNMTKGKRFTSAYELSKALEGNDEDIGGIKGIWLEDNISEPLFISAEKLDLMHDSLRVLALGDMVIVVGMDGQYCTQKFKQIVYFQAGLIPYIPFHPTTSQELRILDWLPHNNNDLQLTKISSKLQVLNLNGVRYEHQFESKGVFARLWSLRTLKLVGFQKLENLPEELSLLTQLEELDVSGCRMLAQLPKGLGELSFLSKLNLQSCVSLQELPDSFGKLRSLKYLDLHFCVTLEQLPQNFGLLSSLEELDLGLCLSLRDLPSSFEKLSSLKALNLLQCRSLNRLPDNMNSLLASVSVADCSSLRDLPEDVCSYLKFVKDLSLSSCNLLTNLPKNLVELAHLRRLDLKSCGGLKNLPEGFGHLKSLADLNLGSCRSLQQLSSDFHCLPSLQILNMEWCRKLEGKWMDSVGKIKTLDLVSILGSEMLVQRWGEMEKEKGEESWHFAIRTRFAAIYRQHSDPEGMTCTKVSNHEDRGDRDWPRQRNESDVSSTNISVGIQEWKNVENMLGKVASKLLTGHCLLTDSQGKPFSLSTVAPSTVVLVMYRNHEDSWSGPWKLLEEVVKHEHPLPFQMIYVGKYFGKLSKSFANRIMAYATEGSDAGSLFSEVLEVTTGGSSDTWSGFLVTKVVAEGGRKNFSTWKDITDSCVDFLLSKTRLYTHLQKLIEAPAESNVKLLRALFDTEESKMSSMFLRNYTEPMGVDGLRGKTVLLFVSVMDQHPFHFLTEIYSKAKTNDDMEILSIPIPVEVQGRSLMAGESVVGLPDSDLAGFESILKTVPWPVLRNPWLLRQEVYYFFQRKCSELNPAILVVVEPNGRIRNKNAMPLVKTWGAEVYPFTEEKMRQLELLDQQPLEEKLSEHILNALLQR